MNDPSGIAALQKAVTATSADKIVVFGYSEGATVVGKWLAEHLDDPETPPPSVLSFVVIGNPTRHGSGIAIPNGVEFPQSNYQVTDVSIQYDGVSDFPNNPASPYFFLAVRNATRGSIGGGLHNYSKVDIYDPANAVWTSPDGNITYVLVPTEYVPVLGNLGRLFPDWNAQLKAQIETAYIRPVPFPTVAAPATPSPPALTTSTVSNPTVTPEHALVAVSPTPPAVARTTDAARTIPESSQTDSLDPVSAADEDDIAPTPTLPDAEIEADTVPTISLLSAEPLLDTADTATPPTTASQTGPATSVTKRQAPLGRQHQQFASQAPAAESTFTRSS